MKRQDFAAWCKENNRLDLLAEWDEEKNSSLGFFANVIGYGGSRPKQWWICPKGHSYDMAVGHRTTRGDGCPYCSNHRLLVGFNDLATVCPSICQEWDFKKNKELHDADVSQGKKQPHPAKPTEILFGSYTKIYWKCKEGHESYLSPSFRQVKQNGFFRGCDKCARKARAASYRKTVANKNNLAELIPQAVEEWMYSEHDLSPWDVSCNSTEMVHWKCKKKGHEFDRTVAARTKLINGVYAFTQCQECSKTQKTSFPEQICFFYIKQVFPDAINTYKKLGFEIDIFIPSLNVGIEYDGSYTHKNKHQKDNSKDLAAKQEGITLYRFRPKSLPNTINSKRITIEETTQGVIDGLLSFFNCLGAVPPSMDIERDYGAIMSIVNDHRVKSVADTPYIHEWDFEKNEYDPRFISSTESHIKVFWKCPNGHPSYKSCPYNRIVRHTKCVKCANMEAERKLRRKVRNIDTGEVFDSISEAERSYGKPNNTSISCCCRGRYKTAYGFHWEFYQEEQKVINNEKEQK